MNFRKGVEDTKNAFPMAPMIDVMFLLLIFFMVMSVHAQWERKVGIKLPATESGERENRVPGEILINIGEEGEIYVNRSQMTLKRLKSLLKSVAQNFKDQPIIIRADGRTDHARVMRVLDVCRELGIWNVAFATVPQDNSPKSES